MAKVLGLLAGESSQHNFGEDGDGDGFLRKAFLGTKFCDCIASATTTALSFAPKSVPEGCRMSFLPLVYSPSNPHVPSQLIIES